MSQLVTDLSRLWSGSAGPPDLVSWWSSVSTATAPNPPSPHELLQALTLDQERRWQSGAPWLVEDYITRLPSLPAGIPWTLELAISEVSARARAGRPTSLDELVTRFPELADTLRSRLSSAGAPMFTDKATDIVKVSPEKLSGRYRLDRLLGQGKFGRVYLAWDEELQRDVAIKVPTAERFQDSRHAGEYLSEARTLATLNHPNILPVYDIGHDTSGVLQDGAIFVVSQFISGGTLGDRLRQSRPTPADAAKLLIPIAEALAAAHARRIIHRDVKPDNVLVEQATGRPYLADFGLAIREDDYRQRPGLAGTPAYMSPEQVRGEGHRLDGRSDVFSLGVVFYEMLTGQRPFQGNDRDTLFHEITTVDPPAPRSIEPGIPPQLEQICLKALAKRCCDRHATATAFAEELQAWLRGKPVTAAATTPALIKPRGLRSFNTEDAESFPELLPGFRDPQGLPESIAFWKRRIEEPDAKRTFSVGLILGPSGCGKSSLIKAGLLPRLSGEITAIYLQATATGTEEDLCASLRQRRPDLPASGSLPELLSTIRRNPGPKVAIFLDQFEQWLHGNSPGPETELVQALRQCHGNRLQAVIMIRDDFAMAAARFLNALEIRLVEGENFATVDRFDLPHATRVLTRFGQALDRLPPGIRSGDAHQQFIDRVIHALQVDGQVICVRLAILADMLRSRPWTPETLDEIGGAERIGEVFLEESFSSPRANPQHRQHAAAARGVLKKLLPPVDTEIKGASQTVSELKLAANYQHRDADFQQLLQILEGDLRLITPTDTSPDSSPPDPTTTAAATSANPTPSPIAPAHSRSFQLTHDYLVPPLREWLTRKQKETVTGRAELKLEDRTAVYTSRRERRYLPGFFDWLQILILTRRKRWTPAETTVMRAATRLHVLRSTAVATVLLLLGLVLQTLLVAKALEGLAGQIQTANPSGLTELLQQADEQGPALDERLRPIIQVADEPTADAPTRLAAVPARLVVVIRDESQLPPLQEALLTGELTYVEPIRTRLQRYAAKLRPQWLELLRNPAEPNARRFRAALGVVGLDGDQPITEWTDADIRFVATELSTSFAEYQPQLRELLRPIGGKLVPVLDELFDAETSTTDQQNSVALALADFATDDQELLARLLTRATARQTEILYPLVAETKTGPVRDGLLALTREQPDENLGQLARVRLGRRRANAAITLLRQGERDAYFDALRITDDPESLSQFVHRCRAWGVTPQELLESFDRCAALRAAATGAAKRLESRVMYALLIALGSYPLNQIAEASREVVFTKLRALYERDPSAAVHSASGWLLRTWGREAEVAKLDEVEVPYDESGERDWFRLRVGVAAKSNGQPGDPAIPGPLQYHSLTFVVFPAGEYRLGSPEFEGGELDRAGNETPRVVQLTRAFALCDREVTWGLYEAFAGEAWRTSVNRQMGWDMSAAVAACAVDWYGWMEFCRWLTKEHRGDDESWQCYQDPQLLEKDGNGNRRVGRLPVDRGGFRMPTESEWEVGARSGQRTAYAFGSDVSLLSSYGWFMEDSAGKRPQLSAAKPPGPGGLHDVQGNLFEWVHDWYEPIAGGSVVLDPQGPQSGRDRVLRGGSWGNSAAYCRAASRSNDAPASRNSDYGLRLALSPSVKMSPEADQKEQQQQGGN